MLTQFQLVLIGIIAIVIVGVLIYNRWQEARYRREAERAFSAARGDALFHNSDEGRVEPSLGALPTVDEPAALEGFDTPLVDRPMTPQAVASDLVPAIHAEIDTVATILADAPVSPDVFAPMIEAAQAISPRILWEGLCDQVWQPVDPSLDDEYRELRAGLQLADRGGPIDAQRIVRFNEAMAGFASGIGAVSQREEADAAVARSQAIDAFAVDCDIEIAVNLVGREGATFAATKVRGLAEANGMRVEENGECTLRDEVGRLLFTLRNGDAAEPPGIRRDSGYHTLLTLALDVPCTPRAAASFERMFGLALMLADRLGADVVDDNHKLLTASGRTLIADAVGKIEAHMAAKGIPTGSANALRLFS